MTKYFGQEKPSLDDLTHFGVRGMKWGVRHDGPEGVSNGTNKEARKDAEEFTRAKLFYGEGAGTRRKLIKAKVEAKIAKDPNYKKAFDYHVANTDLGKRAEQARGERKRKDATNATVKTVKGVRHILNGNSQYANATAALAVSGYLYARRTGIDKVIAKRAKDLYQNLSKSDVERGAEFLRANGFKI